jgi:hypothetical protein
MHELDWLRSADAKALLEWLYPIHGYHSPPAQPRKLRLYFAALGREAWRRMPACGRALIAAAEQIADNPAGTPGLFSRAQRVAEQLTEAFETPGAVTACEADLRELGLDVVPGAAGPWDAREWKALTWLTFLPFFSEVPPFRWGGVVPDAYHRADLVRDIFGSPFRRPRFDPVWRTDTAVALARRMYDGRAFGPMPILADALEDAGCDEADVLAHCRDTGPHVRGCWVVDLVLDLT